MPSGTIQKRTPVATPATVPVVDGRSLTSSARMGQHETVLQSLRESGRVSLRRLFHTLAPPRIETLAGHYDAELLNQGGPFYDALMEFAFGIHGRWIGKTFHPTAFNAGVGYNCFRSKGSIVKKLPLDTTIAPSTLDGEPSLMIRYEAKNRGLITRLFGEVRQVKPNILLGIGIFDPLGRRHAWRRQIPFMLVGPCRSSQCARH